MKIGSHNPFVQDTFAASSTSSTPSVCLHQEARQEFLDVIENLTSQSNLSGRLVLLTASRAGFGKTHLLHRLQELHSSVLMLPLQFDLERSVSWQAGMEQVLHRCHSSVTETEGISVLSACNRTLFAMLNADLIQHGLVDCEDDDKTGTLEALQQRAIEIFDLTEASSAMSQWFLRNFEALLPTLSEAAARLSGISADSASEWLRVLCAYEQGQNDAPSARWQALQWGIGQISQAMQGGFNDGVHVLSVTNESEQLSAKMRLIEFLKLQGIGRIPVIAVDHIDVLHRDVAACLRLADVLTQLTAAVPKSMAVLAVNEDVWNSGFRHYLPSAMGDRLTGSTIRLPGVTAQEAEALVRMRLEQAETAPANVERFIVHSGIIRLIEASVAPISPRAVLRHCSSRWNTFSVTQSVDPVELVAKESPSLFAEGEPVLAQAPNTLPTAAVAAVAVVNGLRPLKPLGSSVGTAEIPPVDLPDASNRIQKVFDARIDAMVEVFAPDPVRIAALLRVAGQQFPMVQYGEEPVPSGNGAPPALVGKWKTGESEVLFGLRPYEEAGYWKSLVRHVEARTPGTRKLAIFDSADRGRISAILGAQADQNIDIVELDSAAVRRLSAASDLLDDAEKGVLEVPVPEAMAGLVDELDFFWKRVTRSLK
ncbi:MAG: hypothetical protein ACI9R3_003694 [Verrucomicrobiales bacterium]